MEPNLIKIGEDYYVSIDFIRELKRCGNYTEITLKNGEFYKVWDEQATVYSKVLYGVK